MVTPLGGGGDSKMSDEEPPLEVYNSRRLSSLNTLTKFLFYSKFNISIHEPRHPLYRKE